MSVPVVRAPLKREEVLPALQSVLQPESRESPHTRAMAAILTQWLETVWARAYNSGVADDQTAADMNYEHSPARVNPFSESSLL